RLLGDVGNRLRALFPRASVEQHLDDELRFHIEREAEKYERQGMLHEAALRRAGLEFGGVEQVKEASRDMRGIARLESIVRDLRYAMRSLKSRPAFTRRCGTTRSRVQPLGLISARNRGLLHSGARSGYACPSQLVVLFGNARSPIPSDNTLRARSRSPIRTRTLARSSSSPRRVPRACTIRVSQCSSAARAALTLPWAARMRARSVPCASGSCS